MHQKLYHFQNTPAGQHKTTTKTQLHFFPFQKHLKKTMDFDEGSAVEESYQICNLPNFKTCWIWLSKVRSQ
jgi:hypothetical protein